MAKTVTLELTRQDLQVLRRLIVEEVRRLDPDGWIHIREPQRAWPGKLRRLKPVAQKIYDARVAIDARCIFFRENASEIDACNDDIEFAPDPYAADVEGNETPVWMCRKHRDDQAMAI